MSRHLSHLTLTHPARVNEPDFENVSGHFRQLDVGDALVRSISFRDKATAFEEERYYRVVSVRHERVHRGAHTERNKADVEFIVAEEVAKP